MAASNLKSQSITLLDQTPPFQLTGGNWGAGYERVVVGSVVAANSDSTASTYKFVRVPVQAKIKSVRFWSNVATAGNADINVVFSDSTADGTSTTNQGTIPQISSANNKLFGSATSLVQAGAVVDATYGNTTNFPEGLAANAAITAALGASPPFQGYVASPTSATSLWTESVNTELWQMLGLGSALQGAPAGWFDIQMNVTTQITTGGAIVMEVRYVVGP